MLFCISSGCELTGKEAGYIPDTKARNKEGQPTALERHDVSLEIVNSSHHIHEQ